MVSDGHKYKASKNFFHFHLQDGFEKYSARSVKNYLIMYYILVFLTLILLDDNKNLKVITYKIHVTVRIPHIHYEIRFALIYNKLTIN